MGTLRDNILQEDIRKNLGVLILRNYKRESFKMVWVCVKMWYCQTSKQDRKFKLDRLKKVGEEDQR